MGAGYRSGVPARPFLYASLTGAFGMNLLMVVSAMRGARDPDMAAGLTMWAGYGLISLPVVALGLLLFGAPLTLVFRRRLVPWWGGAVALVLGAICGRIWWLLLDRTIGFGVYHPLRLSLDDPPTGFGMLTGFAWWLFLRRWLAARTNE